MLENRELLTIFGADGRELIQDASDFPYSAVGRISTTFPSGADPNRYGSGVMISPYHMLTAAHVVYDKNRGGQAYNIQVALGQTGPNNSDKPYGVLNVTSGNVLTYEGWREDRDYRYDLAILRLPGRIGNYTGHLGVATRSDSVFASTILNTVGYPGDRSQNGVDMYRQGATFHDDSNSYNGVNQDFLWTTAFDVYGGQSGGPIYQYSSSTGSRYVVGIASHEYSTTNVFVRINAGHFSAIETVIENDNAGRQGDGRGIVGSGGSSSPTDRADLLDYDSWFGTNFANISSATLRAGELLETRAVVQNNGTGAASSFRVAFYASTDPYISSSDYHLGSTTVASLNAFSWTDARFSGALPAIPAGQYYVGWIIDADNSQTELDESNNTGVLTNQYLTVLANNQAPFANNDAYEVEAGGTLNVAFYFAGVLANDYDPNFDFLTAARVSGPANGQLSLFADGTFSYVPTPGFVGTDSFTYRASDGTSSSNLATVSIQVMAANHPPIASDDYYVIQENQTLVRAAYLTGVLGNDTDTDADFLTAARLSGPQHGELFLGFDGTFTYTPQPGYVGHDSFTYQAYDGSLTSNVATVTIEIQGENDPPVAVDDVYRVRAGEPLVIDAAAGVLANDSDLHGGQSGENNLPLTAEWITLPTHGTLMLEADGGFRYEPAPGFVGADSFTYRAFDSLGNGSTIATARLVVHRDRSLVIGADAGAEPRVRIFDSGTEEMRADFLAYAAGFHGGVRVATGDFNADGVADVVTSPGPTGGPHVRVFDGESGSPAGVLPDGFFAYAATFTGGVFVATGDLNGDGVADIVTSPDKGGGPHIRVFSGDDFSLLGEFFAYDINFTGGVRVAVADVDNNGQLDIITAAGAGGGPHIRVFDTVHGRPLAGPASSFFAFNAGFTGGVYVAAGDLNGDGHADIVTGAGAGGGPHVRAFSGADGSELASFFAFGIGFTGGVRVGTTSSEVAGQDHIVVGAGPGGGPHVRSVDLLGNDAASFFAFGTFAGGIYVAGSSSWSPYVALEPGSGTLLSGVSTWAGLNGPIDVDDANHLGSEWELHVEAALTVVLGEENWQRELGLPPSDMLDALTESNRRLEPLASGSDNVGHSWSGLSWLDESLALDLAANAAPG